MSHRQPREEKLVAREAGWPAHGCSSFPSITEPWVLELGLWAKENSRRISSAYVISVNVLKYTCFCRAIIQFFVVIPSVHSKCAQYWCSDASLRFEAFG